MQKVNPKHLLGSKWSACQPINKEKHFIITEVELNEAGDVLHCVIEAVLTKRSTPIGWQELHNNQQWLQGWQ